MTKISSEAVECFSRLFKGYENAHGQYIISKKDADGKLTGQAKTIMNEATQEDYRLHLDGKVGIGIVPLLKNNKCYFGAIDIDIKGETKLTEDHFILEARIRALKLPLLLCSSKSNGVHLYFFGSEAISARLVQAKLTEWAAILGYAGCEVFPKQITRIKETDCGNWINLPFFGSERKAIHSGKQLATDAAFSVAGQLQFSNIELRDFDLDISTDFEDGPPCLQQLATIGIKEGGRNGALFNMAVYFKSKHPDTWPEVLSSYNSENFNPPLPSEEVKETIRSATSKEYNYTCKQAPIVSHCNRKLCKTRPHGVSGGKDSSPKLPIKSITKYVAGDSVRYGANTGDVMIEFSEDEFFSIDSHRKKFAAYMSFCLSAVKQIDFYKQIDELLKGCETVIDPEDASETGTLINAFESWFKRQYGAVNVDDMVKLKWWLEEATDTIYFTKEALDRYLSRHKDIKKYEPHKMFRTLKAKFGIEGDTLKIKGERDRVWKMKNFNAIDETPLEVPKNIQLKDIM